MDATKRLMRARQQYESLLIQAGDIMQSNNGGIAVVPSSTSISTSSLSSFPEKRSIVNNSTSNNDFGFGGGADSRMNLTNLANKNNMSHVELHVDNSDRSELSPSRFHQINRQSSSVMNSSQYDDFSKLHKNNSNEKNYSKANNNFNNNGSLSDSLGTNVFRMNHKVNDDDSRTVILALQVENEKLKEKLNSYAKQAQETVTKLQSDHEHLENIFSQREKSLLRKIEQQNTENEILREDFSKIRSDLALEREKLLKALRHIDRLKGKSRSGKLMPNVKFYDSTLDESQHRSLDSSKKKNIKFHHN